MLVTCTGKAPDKLQEHELHSMPHASRHPSCQHAPRTACYQEMTVQCLPQAGLADAAAESCASDSGISQTIAANQAQPNNGCAAVLLE